ncbi:WXG100 family type VII secretion target [Streptomyces sp. NPDC001348]
MSEQQQPSSGDVVRVDTEQIRQAIGTLEGIWRRLDQAGRDLVDRSNELGDCWGDDKSGKKFHEKYWDPHENAIDAAVQGAKVLKDATEQVQDMVSAYEQVEQNATDTATNLGTGMGA